jgi:IPT/TIG domain
VCTATGKASIGNVPVITAVSPTSGTHLGGKTVTITGTNFKLVTSVKFGTAAATFTVNSATKITVKTPHAKGTVDIRVTTKYGTSKITSHDKYTFT